MMKNTILNKLSYTLFIITEQATKSMWNYLLMYVITQKRYKVVIGINKIQQKSRSLKQEQKEDRGNNSGEKWDDDKFDKFSKPNIRNNYSNLQIHEITVNSITKDFHKDLPNNEQRRSDISKTTIATSGE